MKTGFLTFIELVERWLPLHIPPTATRLDHVSHLADDGVNSAGSKPHQASKVLERHVLYSVGNNVKTGMDYSETLKSSGIAVVGVIDEQIIKDVKSGAESSTSRTEFLRQTELPFDENCRRIKDKVLTSIKPNVRELQDKECVYHELVKFNDIENDGPILRAIKAQEDVWVLMIIIGEGDGFPRYLEGSQTTPKSDISSITAGSMKPIPQKEGQVVVLDSRIIRQEPAVKPGKGGKALNMVFQKPVVVPSTPPS